jgi:cytochrome c553
MPTPIGATQNQSERLDHREQAMLTEFLQPAAPLERRANACGHFKLLIEKWPWLTTIDPRMAMGEGPLQGPCIRPPHGAIGYIQRRRRRWRVKRVLVLAALIAGIGCSEESPPAATEATTRQASVPARDRPTEVEMVAAMEGHYSTVILAHDALLQGNLETFRSQLALVPDKELPTDAPQHWLPLQEELHTAARRGEDVSNLEAAADALAQVVLACGTCHAALGEGPIYPAPAPDDGDSALEAAMFGHKWATERLWEGVTGPWDNAWERGANSLAVVEVFGEANPDLILSEELERRELALREIGEEAKTTTALDERAALYGRLLATCGGCHQRIGVTFEEAN